MPFEQFEAKHKVLFYLKPHSYQDWDKKHKRNISFVVSETGGVGGQPQENVEDADTDRIAANMRRKKIIIGINKDALDRVYSERDEAMESYFEEAIDLPRVTNQGEVGRAVKVGGETIFDDPIFKPEDLSVWTAEGWVPIQRYLPKQNIQASAIEATADSSMPEIGSRWKFETNPDQTWTVEVQQPNADPPSFEAVAENGDVLRFLVADLEQYGIPQEDSDQPINPEGTVNTEGTLSIFESEIQNYRKLGRVPNIDYAIKQYLKALREEGIDLGQVDSELRETLTKSFAYMLRAARTFDSLKQIEAIEGFFSSFADMFNFDTINSEELASEVIKGLKESAPFTDSELLTTMEAYLRYSSIGRAHV